MNSTQYTVLSTQHAVLSTLYSLRTPNFYFAAFRVTVHDCQLVVSVR